MTAAYRFKGIGWFGSCVAVVLGFYLVSLQVAAERKKLDDVNGRIRSAERDIRALETEFDTRANLVQLEKWNGDTLSLSAPIAGQFVTNEGMLASIDVTQPLGAQVRTAALVVPSGVPVPLGGAAPVVTQMASVATPQPQVVAAAVVRAVAPTRASETAIVRTAAAIAKVRPQAVAMLDRKLLSDSTLGDILSGARNEAGRLR